jgi:hypothetical protein
VIFTIILIPDSIGPSPELRVAYLSRGGLEALNTIYLLAGLIIASIFLTLAHEELILILKKNS